MAKKRGIAELAERIATEILKYYVKQVPNGIRFITYYKAYSLHNIWLYISVGTCRLFGSRGYCCKKTPRLFSIFKPWQPTNYYRTILPGRHQHSS